MRTVPLAIFTLASTGCQRVAPPSIREQRLAVPNQISDECGLRRSTFRLVDDNKLGMQASAGATFEKLDRALTELKNNKLVGNLPTGFVGNEYYSNEVQ